MNFFIKLKKILNIFCIRNNIFKHKKFKNNLLIFSILIPISFQKQLLSDVKSIKSDLENNTIKWKKLNIEKQNTKTNYLEKNRKIKIIYYQLKKI